MRHHFTVTRTVRIDPDAIDAIRKAGPFCDPEHLLREAIAVFKIVSPHCSDVTSASAITDQMIAQGLVEMMPCQSENQGAWAHQTAAATFG
jgi:hypothetical protein